MRTRSRFLVSLVLWAYVVFIVVLKSRGRRGPSTSGGARSTVGNHVDVLFNSTITPPGRRTPIFGSFKGEQVRKKALRPGSM